MPSEHSPFLGQTDVTVIGGGAAGAMLLMQWQRQLCWPGNVIWCEGSGAFALGAAYRTTHPRHLLNVMCSRMGCYANKPEDFLAWVEQSEAEDAIVARANADIALGEQYLPRRLYGHYLQTRLEEALAPLPADALHKHPHGITHIEPAAEGGYFVHSPAGHWHSNHLVLAMGNQPNSRWDAAAQQSPRWLGNSWYPLKPMPLHSTTDELLIIGAGLSAIDTVMSVRDAGWQGEITLASRHGHLPHAHALHHAAPYAHRFDDLQGKRPAALARYLRALVRAGADWRSVIDGLRPYTILLWQAWSIADQQRFLKQLWPWWNIHRHRHAPQATQWLDTALSPSYRNPVAAGVKQVILKNEALEAALQHGGTMHPAAIADCTGPSLSVLANPGCLSELLAEGLIAAARNGAGLETFQQHAAYTGSHGTILALGTLTLGMRLETTAIPELRQQAAEAASQPLPR